MLAVIPIAAVLFLGYEKNCQKQNVANKSVAKDDPFTKQTKRLAKEMEVHGMITPKHMTIAGRVPYRADKPPYAIYQKRVTHKKDFKHIFKHYLHAVEHDGRVIADDLVHSRTFHPWKVGGALVGLFTREIHLPDGRRSNILNNSYLPNNTTNKDFEVAHRMAHMVPRERAISADAHYWTAPGQTFRHIF